MQVSMRLSLLTLILFALLAGSASAYPRLPEPLPPVTGNPANKLLDLAIEDSTYDGARTCKRRARAGIAALSGWLDTHTRGVFWGSYRCEKWGKDSASLHAENRAIDWHLDAASDADQRAADRLFRLLLAPDKAGNLQALARRMGVQELIWDCGYWGAGMTNFQPYSVCFDEKGKRRKGVDKTSAHRDHIHIGMTKAGANGRTSFWVGR
jgi:hypothetical protein